MILLKLSLVCYSVPLQDKLKIPPVQKPLLQLLAFGHHELRDASSSQKVTDSSVFLCLHVWEYSYVVAPCATLIHMHCIALVFQVAQVSTGGILFLSSKLLGG